MAQVFAGFVCGYVLALVSAPVVAVRLLTARAEGGLLARLLPPNASLVPVALVVHGGLFVVWTGVGIVLGLLLMAMDGAGSAAGSANAAFTLFVAGLTLAVVAPVALLSARWRSPAIVGGGLALALFGWLMPHLAEWAGSGSV